MTVFEARERAGGKVETEATAQGFLCEWGVNAFLGDRTVDVHILRLRKLLKPQGADRMIATVRGSGYRLSDLPANWGIIGRCRGSGPPKHRR